MNKRLMTRECTRHWRSGPCRHRQAVHWVALTRLRIGELRSRLLLPQCLRSGCVAFRETKRWDFQQHQESGNPRPSVEITMMRPGLYLSLPLVGWEVRGDKRYKLRLDVHTWDVVHDRLDSVGYRFWVHPHQVLAPGTLPVVNGPVNRREYSPGAVSRREYSPDLYRTQCETPARIVLPNLNQPLNGTFWL